MLRLTNIKANEWIEKFENYSKQFRIANRIYIYTANISSMDNTPIVYTQHLYYNLGHKSVDFF